MVKKCPICNSTRLKRIDEKTFRCDRCGYEHKETRNKVIISSGTMEENWWMR